MKIWYKTSAHQMDDTEMEYIQSVDAGGCAVWEWAKGICKQRDDCTVPERDEIEMMVICRRLGIDEKRMERILTSLEKVGWIERGEGFFLRIANWDSWQTNFRSSESDAKRKRNAYHTKKTEEGNLKLDVPTCLQDADFLKEWREWIRYRRSMAAPVSDESIFFQRQLKWLAGYGPKKAIQILDATMRNSWQGLEAAAKILDK